MNLKHMKIFGGIAAVLLLTAMTAMAQPSSSELWITIKDNISASDSVVRYFGNHLLAKYGIDSLNPTIKEAEYPPPAFSFDARWANIPLRPTSTANGGMGSGLIPWDFRPVPNNATKKDTFKLSFGYSDHPEADFTFEWPNSTFLSLRCDSIFFQYKIDDGTGTLITVKINMMNQTTETIPQAGNNSTTNAFIYKYGANIIDAVKEEKKSTLPSSFALHQNYPNPFNPTTTIQFDIQKRAVADIAVFNMLGQRIATLASEEFVPGTYSTTWNGLNAQGRGVSSGVYYVRMVARTSGNEKVEQFSDLRKLLLMK